MRMCHVRLSIAGHAISQSDGRALLFSHHGRIHNKNHKRFLVDLLIRGLKP